jgi:hypothetical protein
MKLMFSSRSLPVHRRIRSDLTNDNTGVKRDELFEISSLLVLGQVNPSVDHRK